MTEADLTEQQLVVLATYIQMGSAKETADHLGIALSTVKTHLSNVYQRLNVGSAMEAAVALGWVNVPTTWRICGWTGICTRHQDHKGQHGGFRGVTRKRET